MVPSTLAGVRAKIDFAMSAQYVTECLTSTGTDEPLRIFSTRFMRPCAKCLIERCPHAPAREAMRASKLILLSLRTVDVIGGGRGRLAVPNPKAT
jgi:hypothetical protein